MNMNILQFCFMDVTSFGNPFQFTGIILAAMIMHQLHSRQPALSDVEGKPPGYSQMLRVNPQDTLRC